MALGASNSSYECITDVIPVDVFILPMSLHDVKLKIALFKIKTEMRL